MQIFKPSSQSSSSAIVRLQGGYRCIICDVALTSQGQVEIHLLGKRHASNLAHKDARGPERWSGQLYGYYNFWNNVRELIPGYPTMFDDSLLRTQRSGSMPSGKSVAKGCVKHQQEGAVSSSCRFGSSVCPSESSQTAERIIDRFFEDNYRTILRLGEFYCELCHTRFPESEAFYEHLASPPHRIALKMFEKIADDYFQPVRCGSAVVFIGLGSKSVIVSDDFYTRKKRAMETQWSVSGRTPDRDSIIMQSTPRELVDLLTGTTVHDI